MQKMRIKKHNNKNNYLRTEDGLWVRDFSKVYAPAIDINQLASDADYQLFPANELTNISSNRMQIDADALIRPKIAIVSDGFNFQEKQKILATLPSDVFILATNGALAKWQLAGKNRPTDVRKIISCYVTNNPYPTYVKDLPKHNYCPTCIASYRTNSMFVNNYKGTVSFYTPTPGEFYGGVKHHCEYTIDDYRNPICAAIGLSYRFKVQKLLLFCCDESFADPRPSSIPLSNGLFCYPPHLVAQRLIDANLHWLKKQGVEIMDHSCGIQYNNSTYVTESEIPHCFENMEN
jgi:hypothetical protein